eukprot:1341422-Amorphochlora_amoeboformis.AAC.1
MRKREYDILLYTVLVRILIVFWRKEREARGQSRRSRKRHRDCKVVSYKDETRVSFAHPKRTKYKKKLSLPKGVAYV